jgi:hypothetical protein
MTTTKHVLLPLVTVLALAACGGGSDNSPPVISPTTTTSGKAVDGYLSDSTVFCDTNKNNIRDAGEMSTTTDNGGNFTFSTACASTVVVSGGTDTATGYAFKGLLNAKAGSAVVTPLTSLLSQSGLTQAQLAIALGLSSGIDVAQVDPMSNGIVLRKTLAVQQILQQLANIFGTLTSPLAVPGHYVKVANALGGILLASPNTPLVTPDGKINSVLIKEVIEKTVQSINADSSSPVTLTPADVTAVTDGIVAQTEQFLQAPEAELINLAKQLQNPLNPPIATDTALNNYIFPKNDSISLNGSQKKLADFASASGITVNGLDTIALEYAAKGTPEINAVVDVAMSLEEIETIGYRVLQVKVEQVRVKRSSADGLVKLELTPDTQVHIFADDGKGSNFNVSLTGLSFNPISIVNNAVTMKYSELVNKIAGNSLNTSPFAAGQFTSIQGTFNVKFVVSSNLNVRKENEALPIINIGIHNTLRGVTGPGIEGLLTIN